MTGNKVLLDTNIISALLKGEADVAGKIDKAAEVNIPIIVVGELYYGAHYSTRIEKNINAIEKLTATYNVISHTNQTAKIYGSIKAQLRKKGTPIPENDIWIAAIAQQHNLTLITRDKHFREIEGITIRKW